MSSIVNEDMEFILQDFNIPWEMLYGKTVLISGISGVLPAYMAETLLYLNQRKKAGIRIVGLVRNLDRAEKRFQAYAGNPNLKLYQQDVSEFWDPEENFDFIIHAASHASPKFYGADPVGTILPNVEGTRNLLEIGKRDRVKSVLYFSSGAIYGIIPEEQYPIKETQCGEGIDPLNPRACYAESKRLGETLCRAYYDQYDVPAKIVRIAHTYGPGVSLDDGRSFADFISAVVQGKDIVLNSDGSARRPFLYLADATRAFFTVLLKGVSGEAYNVGYNRDMSILELAKMLVEMYPEKNLKIRFAAETRKGYVAIPTQSRCLDIQKIRTLGWEPRISEAEGFRRTIQSILE